MHANKFFTFSYTVGTHRLLYIGPLNSKKTTKELK